MANSAEIVHPEISEIHVFQNRGETAEAAARRVISAVQVNPEVSITYATGDTMIPVYAELSAAVQRGEVDFSRTKAFHLDEYYPASPSDEFGFVYFLNKHVFEPLGISKENIHTLNGQAKDPNAEAARYDKLLQEGVGIAILGMGPGTHIGFNERGTPHDSRTHLATLSEETIHRDQVERGQASPEAALTQGIATILEAEMIVLVAYGEKKGEYLHEALYGDISENAPGSALRTVGEKVSLYIDTAAASKLE